MIERRGKDRVMCDVEVHTKVAEHLLYLRSSSLYLIDLTSSSPSQGWDDAWAKGLVTQDLLRVELHV